jgi:hypothetical protein
MVTIPIKTRLEANGTLSLSVPTGLPESDVEVVVIIQPVSDSIATWPEGFFEQTYGAFAEQPLARAPQGEFDARDTSIDLLTQYKYLHSIFERAIDRHQGALGAASP